VPRSGAILLGGGWAPTGCPACWKERRLTAGLRRKGLANVAKEGSDPVYVQVRLDPEAHDDTCLVSLARAAEE